MGAENFVRANTIAGCMRTHPTITSNKLWDMIPTGLVKVSLSFASCSRSCLSSNSVITYEGLHSARGKHNGLVVERPCTERM